MAKFNFNALVKKAKDMLPPDAADALQQKIDMAKAAAPFALEIAKQELAALKDELLGSKKPQQQAPKAEETFPAFEEIVILPAQPEKPAAKKTTAKNPASKPAAKPAAKATTPKKKNTGPKK